MAEIVRDFFVNYVDFDKKSLLGTWSELPRSSSRSNPR
jgi:hypothetical protein